VRNYPRFKLLLNRIANFGIRVLFRHGYNDTTNAFKASRREVVETVSPSSTTSTSAWSCR
jgi:dolichol-phosphate mannosyltransferase